MGKKLEMENQPTFSTTNRVRISQENLGIVNSLLALASIIINHKIMMILIVIVSPCLVTDISITGLIHKLVMIIMPENSRISLKMPTR